MRIVLFLTLLFRLSAFICSISTESFNDSKQGYLRKGKTWNLAAENFPKKYYTDSAFNFLLNYGQHYDLFKIFYDTNDRINQLKPYYSAQREKFRFSESGDGIYKDGPPLENHNFNSDLSHHYLVRDYSYFQTWNMANATVNEEYRHLYFEYSPKPNDQFFIDYSNRFRYGPKLNDRFFYIGLNYDIWEWKNPYSGFYQDLATNPNPYYVYFIGAGNNFQERQQLGQSFYCNFSIPNHPTYSYLLTPVEIQQDIRDVLGKLIDDNIVRCQVPIALLESLDLIQNHNLDHNQEQQQTISLHFYQSVVESNQIVNTSLLRDITIPRLHELDRRSYTFTIETLVETLEDSMVIEWLIYNILLGVEHFYLFLNTKEVNYSLQDSLLRPFLDANIVTIIYYPYFHTGFYHVQRSAFNVHLFCFGLFQEWTSYSDVDEFLVPSPQFLPANVSALRGLKKSIIHQLLLHLAPDNEPGVMFDTLEMDCPVNSHNFYHGGDNIRFLPKELQTSETKNENSSNSSDSTDDRLRPAVSTHCHRTGVFFHEMTMGHGKMYLRPRRLRYLVSPHRLNDYDVVWTTPERGGLFRHFDRFRYTYALIRSGHSPPLEQIEGTDESLKQLTLNMLEAYLGLTIDRSTKSTE